MWDLIRHVPALRATPLETVQTAVATLGHIAFHDCVNVCARLLEGVASLAPPVPLMVAGGASHPGGQRIVNALGATADEVMRLLCFLYGTRLPSHGELFWCRASTTRAALDVFLDRALLHAGSLQFSLINVNALRPKLLERIFSFQVDVGERDDVAIDYIFSQSVV